MRKRRRQPVSQPVSELEAQLERTGLSAEAVRIVSDLCRAHAIEAAQAEVTSLAGLVLERIEQAGPTKKDPAHRTSGAMDLAGAIAGAFADRLQQTDDPPAA